MTVPYNSSTHPIRRSQPNVVQANRMSSLLRLGPTFSEKIIQPERLQKIRAVLGFIHQNFWISRLKAKVLATQRFFGNFHPQNWGRWSQFDYYFSTGLKPPKKIRFYIHGLYISIAKWSTSQYRQRYFQETFTIEIEILKSWSFKTTKACLKKTLRTVQHENPED